ncbi:MAG: GerMN domain-containing protein [Candidatus Zixiibacteriota bacterium]|jgi:spore germination protein GerM
MAKKSPNRFWKWTAAAIVAAATLALIWSAYRYRNELLAGLAPAGEEGTAETAAATGESEAADIYFADAEYTELVAEKREVAATETPEERVRLVVAELIAGPRSAELSPTLPSQAKLISVFLQDGVAILNFDKNIQSDKFGSTGELFAVNSLYETVTANVAGVDGIQIRIEGRRANTLTGDGGHVAAGFPVYGELGRYVSPPPTSSRESSE